MNVSIEEISGGLGNESFFNHSSGVGEVQLKDVTTGFNIKADRDSVLHNTVGRAVKLSIIFRVERNARCEFDSSSGAEAIYDIGVRDFSHRVAMYDRWR